MGIDLFIKRFSNLNFNISNRRISTSIIDQSFKNVSRESRTINRIVFGKQSTKRKWYVNNDSTTKMPTATTFSQNKGPGKEALRRISVLNKLFMTNITDLMATGQYAEEILGNQIEISRVKVTQDFQRVNVYWLAKGDTNDIKVHEILNKAAFSIRHELSQLRLMGEVPRIFFVKDKQYAKVLEIDTLLINADLGSDVLPSKDDVYTEEKTISESLGKMKQDVFGLNYQEIMDKILRNMNKSKQAWEKYEYGSNSNEDESIKLTDVNIQVEVQSKTKDEKLKKYLELQRIKRFSINQVLNKDQEYVLVENKDYLLDDLYKPENEDFIEDDDKK